MPVQRIFNTLALCLVAACIISCTNRQSNAWSVYFENIGTYSSPRVIDLNNDGIKDIVMGTGGKEEEYCDTAVIALDGATGKLLWTIPGSNQYVGSAVFIDINHDGTPDVLIGGRWAQFTAIDGANGKPIWSFFPERARADGSDGNWYNFTTPQLIPDQDQDGLPDLVVANGGDARAKAQDPHRPAGRILVLSSSTGKILANVQVPDSRETYMSVVCEQAGENNINVFFGTGGETLPGHLYKTTLQAIMNGDISQAKVLASGETKGFVASPVLADIDKDGVNDVIVNAVEGRLLAISGATDSVLWQVIYPGTEAYTIPAPGFFNNDSIPDFYANFAIGTFPVLNWSIRFMINGKDGSLLFRDTIPAFQYASAVTADLDGDGKDEIIVNQSEMKRRQFDNVYYSYLFAFDPGHKKNYPLGDTIMATNLASTPWVGDLDADNQYDIICSAVQYQDIKFDFQKPRGLRVSRYKTPMKIKSTLKWSGFMGENNNGIFSTGKSKY